MSGFEKSLAAKGLEVPKSGLHRIKTALAEQSLPWDAQKSVLVVGTNGKGSTVFYLSQLLTRSGQSVLSFLSPHLQNPRERFLFNGKPISALKMDAATKQLRKTISNFEDLSFFEFLTALLPILRQNLRPDWVVMEAGLGGKLDATNLLPHHKVILTGLARDHAEILGHTQGQRLKDKLGVLSAGNEIILGPLSPALRHAALAQIAESGAIVKNDLPPAPLRPRLDHDYPPLVQAAKLAGQAAWNWCPKALDHPVPLDQHLPGRADRFKAPGRSGFLLLDVAHNPQAATAIGSYARKLAGDSPFCLAFTLLARKEAKRVVSALVRSLKPSLVLLPGPWQAQWVSAPVHPPEDLKTLFEQAGIATKIASSPDNFYQSLLEFQGNRLLCGSFQFLGGFLTHSQAYNDHHGHGGFERFRP